MDACSSLCCGQAHRICVVSSIGCFVHPEVGEVQGNKRLIGGDECVVELQEPFFLSPPNGIHVSGFCDATGEGRPGQQAAERRRQVRCRAAGTVSVLFVSTHGDPLMLSFEICNLQAKDDLGNKRLSGGDEFVVELRGPSAVYATVADNGDGTYTATFNTTAAGDHMVHISTGRAAQYR